MQSRRRTSEFRRRQSTSSLQRRRNTGWSLATIAATILMGHCALSYNIHVPKVARPQTFGASRTRLGASEKKDPQHEQSFTARPPSKRTSSSKVAMTSTVVDHSVTQSPTFESRMRNMVLTGSKTKKKQPVSRNLPRNVRVVETLQEYREIVGEEKERIVVARFYAPWCKACKAIQPVFYRLAHTFSNVQFVEVPVTDENATLHQGLGVPSLPFGHIYHPSGGLVEELSISRKLISQFGHKLQTYVTGRCELRDRSPKSPYQALSDEDDS